MTEGTTPWPDRPRKGTLRRAPTGDETVSFPPGDGLEGAVASADPAPADPGPAGPTVDPPAPAGSTARAAVPPGAVTIPPGVGAPPPGASSSNALTAVAIGGVVVLVVVILLMAVVLGGGDDDPERTTGTALTTETTETTTEAPTTAAPTSAAPTSAVPTSAVPTTPTTAAPATTMPPVTEVGGGSNLPAGLLCRDLLARGLGYDEAVAYWLEQRRPAPMDEDLDGVPCETVYPARDVEAVFGPQLEDDGIEPGLLCRDVQAQGLDYSAAVTYWFQEGQPARMDDDGNGRPCETVYPPDEVDAFWG